MNRFIDAAIQNMELVEHDHDRERPIAGLREQRTQEAIAYALIAIAEELMVMSDNFEGMAERDRLAAMFSDSQPVAKPNPRTA